jgi:hypothetical protein
MAKRRDKKCRPHRYVIRGPIWKRDSQACRYALAGVFQKGGIDNQAEEDLPAASESFQKAPPPRRDRPARARIAADISKRTSQLLGDYRAQLERLRKRGWPPQQHPIGWARAVNCPPAGVLTRLFDRRPPCRHRSLCPWCWCRQYVRDTYLNVEYAIYGTNEIFEFNARSAREERALPQGSWNLLVCSRKYGTFKVDELERMWDEIQSTRQLSQKALRRFGGVDGMFYLYVIYPQDIRKKTQPCFVVEKRLLVLAEAKFALNEGDSFEEAFSGGRYAGEVTCLRRYHNLSRRELIGAVGTTCSYPRQLLYGSPDLLFLLLERKRRQFIPASERLLRFIKEQEAEEQKPFEQRNADVFREAARTYVRNTGIRLSANVGLFRNGSRRS